MEAIAATVMGMAIDSGKPKVNGPSPAESIPIFGKSVPKRKNEI